MTYIDTYKGLTNSFRSKNEITLKKLHFSYLPFFKYVKKDDMAKLVLFLQGIPGQVGGN